jgi:hypothetical protein
MIGRKLLTAMAAAGLVAGTLLSAGSVLAVHDDGLFELDRNATSNPAVAGEDWDVVFNNTDTADAASFVADGRGPTIFTGGGSKDDLNTSGWKHKNGSTPDKDELLDGFAARYDDNIYFGADRYSNSGDAVMGFWFFQNEITALTGGSFGPDVHEDGDILVLSDFSGGGGNVTIRVFQWNGPGGTNPTPATINGTLDLIAGTTATPADCVGPPSVPANDPFCATVNTTNVPSPWPFQAKAAGSPANVFPTGHLFEGGIDLAFLNLEDECFASFLAETRSSTSVDAVLKDFVGGAFQPCETSTTTTPSDSNGDPVTSIVLGDSIHDYAVVAGLGSSNAPTGTVTFSICAPDELDDPGTLPNGDPDNPATCDIGGTFVSTNALTPITGEPNSDTLSDSYTPDAIGTWCWRGVYSGDDNYPASSDSSIGECFTVVTIPTTTSTDQNWIPNDSATVSTTGPAGYNLTGSVTFTLYGPGDSDCNGTVAYTETVNIPAAAGLSETVSTSNGNGGADDYVVTDGAEEGTYSWLVAYTPAASDPAHTGSGSDCHAENSTISITEP